MLTEDLPNEIEVPIPPELENLETVYLMNYVKGYIYGMVQTEYLNQEEGIEKTILSSLFYIKRKKNENNLLYTTEALGYNTFVADNVKLMSQVNFIFKKRYGL